MKVLIAESKWTGHHLFFAAGIARVLAPTGNEIVLSVSNSDDEMPRRMIGLATADLPPTVAVRTSLQGPAAGHAHIGDRDGIIELEAIEHEVAELRPDVVVVPSGDALAFHLGGSARRHGLNSPHVRLVLHQPYLGYGDRGWRFAVKRELVRHRFRKVRTKLAAIDQRIARSLGSRRGLTLIPDPPADCAPISRAEARSRFGIRSGARLFLAAGEHSARKGTDRLVDCWPRGLDDHTNLLIVGRCSDDVRKAVSNRPEDVEAGRIRLVDEVVDVETHLAAFHAADVVTACYPQHFGASGILNTAVAVGRPLIGSDYGCIGETIRSFGLGAAIDCRRSTVLSTALEGLLTNPPALDPERSRPLQRFHTTENHRRVLEAWVLQELDHDRPPLPFPPPGRDSGSAAFGAGS